MIRVKFYFMMAMIVACLLCSTIVWGQSSAPDFGIFTSEEISMKQYDFDKDADAVVLLDKAKSTYTDDYSLRTERRIRLKILQERGIERGNIHISYYSGDRFESVYKIEGIVVNFDINGNESRSKLDNKYIYDKQLNKYYSEVSFAMPNVKVGSIIEYKYVSEMKHYGGLKEWVFQSDMPVVLSSFYLTILPNAEFAYSVYKVRNLPITITPDKANGALEFEMRNIPGLRDEAYMASAHDYLQRVKFQFAGYKQVTSDGYNSTITKNTDYTNTWKKLAEELWQDSEFGGQINKTLPGAAALQQDWALQTDNFVRMKSIHRYVKSTFNWNGMNSKYAAEGVKSTWEKKSGTSGDINLILINLLKSAGLDVQPLLVSERNHGKVDTSYPFSEQFNKVVAYVKIGNDHYILDGSDRETPTGTIPFDLLNTIGFIADKKFSALLQIADMSKINSNVVEIKGRLSSDGRMSLNAEVDDYDYAKLERQEKYKRDKKHYEKNFFEPYKLPFPDTFIVNGISSDTLPMHHEVKLTYPLDKSGDYYLLNYNLFTGFYKNPFINGHRFTNINFGSRYHSLLTGKIELPDNVLPEALPKNVRLKMPDESIVFARQIIQDGNTLQIDFSIDINKTEFNANEYEVVQSFYRQMIDMLNEQIVLKRK